jgi:hypothetical protein
VELSRQLLVFALAIGALATLTALRTHDGRVRISTITTAGLTIALLTVIGSWIWTRTAGLSSFGVVHLAYLVVTVSIPLTSATMWIRSRRRGAEGPVVALLLIGVLIAPLGLYATYIEPFWLHVDRVSIDIASVEDPIRIGILADLQTPRVGNHERDAVRSLLDESPDIVLIPGDFWQVASGHPEGTIAAGFRELLIAISEEVDHAFAVVGDTDNVGDLRALAAGTKIVVLSDEIVEAVINGTTVQIAGISGETERSYATIDSLSLLADDALRIVLVHRPDIALHLQPGHSIDLVVAGHTHGGQAAIPFIGPLITLSDVPLSVAAGGPTNSTEL